MTNFGVQSVLFLFLRSGIAIVGYFPPLLYHDLIIMALFSDVRNSGSSGGTSSVRSEPLGSFSLHIFTILQLFFLLLNFFLSLLFFNTSTNRCFPTT